MNKRVLIGIAAALVVAVVGFFALGKVDNELEGVIRQGMADAGIKAETLQVSSRNQGIVATNVVYEMEFAGYTLRVTAEKLEAVGVNRKAFEVSNGGKLPVVADKLIVTNWATSLIPSAEVKTRDAYFESYETKVQEIVIEDWRQDIGTLIKLYKESPWSEEFFSSSLKSYMKSCVCKGYDITASLYNAASSDDTDDLTAVHYTIGEFSLLKPLGSPDGSENRMLSFQFKDINMEMGDFMSTHQDSGEIHDLWIPSPKFLAKVVGDFDDLIKAASDPDLAPDSPVVKAMLNLLKEEFAHQAPWSKFAFTGYTATLSEELGGESSSFDYFENTLDFSDGYSVGLLTKGVEVPADLLESIDKRVLAAYMGENPKMDTGFTFKLTPGTKGDSLAGITYNIPNLGSGRAEAAFKVKLENLMEMLNDPDQALKQIDFVNLDMNFEDTGLLSFLYCLGAVDSTAGSVTELKKIGLQSVAEISSSAGPNGPQVRQALETMLKTPGKLNLKITAKKPMPVEQVAMAMLFGMQGLDLVIEATPGPKALEDYVPAELADLK